MAVITDNIANFLDVVDLIPQLYDPEENKFNVLSEIEIRSLNSCHFGGPKCLRNLTSFRWGYDI